MAKRPLSHHESCFQFPSWLPQRIPTALFSPVPEEQDSVNNKQSRRGDRANMRDGRWHVQSHNEKSRNLFSSYVHITFSVTHCSRSLNPLEAGTTRHLLHFNLAQNQAPRGVARSKFRKETEKFPSVMRRASRFCF